MLKHQYPYTPRQLNSARSEYAANLQLANLAHKHRPMPNYVRLATKHNKFISRIFGWSILLGVCVGIGVLLAWRG